MSKPQPVLQQMPMHIKQLIAGKLTDWDRMSLRKTNRSFHSLIGDPQVHYEDVELSVDTSRIQIRLDEESRHWVDQAAAAAAVEAFHVLVDNPNLTIGTLNLNLIYGDVFEKILHTLPSTLLHVRRLVTSEEQLQVLRHLNPRVLSSLQVVPMSSRHGATLAQWTGGVGRLVTCEHAEHRLLPEHWWDFAETQVHLRHCQLDDLRRILEHFRHSATFKSSSITTPFEDRQMARFLAPPRRMWSIVDGSVYVFIPADDGSGTFPIHLYFHNYTVHMQRER